MSRPFSQRKNCAAVHVCDPTFKKALPVWTSDGSCFPNALGRLVINANLSKSNLSRRPRASPVQVNSDASSDFDNKYK